MAGLEAYYTPYAIGAASGGYILYVNNFAQGVDVIAGAAQAFTSGGSQATNRIITLPNGARYDVNQSYEAQTILGPITWNIRYALTRAGKSGSTDESTRGYYIGALAYLLEQTHSNNRVFAIGKRYFFSSGGSEYQYIVARISSYEYKIEPGTRHNYTDVSITFDPISVEWKSGYPQAGDPP